MKMRKKITVVIPVYQNASTIKAICKEIAITLNTYANEVDYDFVLVNDGSTDGSWVIMLSMQKEQPHKFTLVNLTRNFGQVYALLAGYAQADGDCIISMAADMQDPPSVINEMLDAWLNGHKLVVAVRSARNDGAIRDFVSNLAWKILKRYAVPRLPKGGFDFFAMDKEIRDYYIKAPEQHIFIQGRLLYYGIDPFVVSYIRPKRLLGKSQTTFAKKIKYFIDAFIGYSFIPLRAISLIGIFFFLLSVIAAFAIICYVIINGSKVEGWASTIVIILFLNGIQLLSFGVIGEYLWRNIEESRKRPHYVIGEIIEKV